METVAEIKNKVEAVLEYSQDVRDLDLTDLIDEWYEAKQFFIQAMGDYIYTHPTKVTFHLSEENKKIQKEKFTEELYQWNYSYSLARYLMTRTTDEFFSNTVKEEYEFDGHFFSYLSFVFL